jgi:hypothetical protein
MVTFAEFDSRGDHNWIVRDLRAAHAALLAVERGHTPPKLISSVTPAGQFIGDAHATIFDVMDHLRGSGRLYRQGNTTIFLHGRTRPDGSCGPTPIVVDGIVTKVASAIIGNVLMCRAIKSNPKGNGAKADQPPEYETQFPVPLAVLQQAFVSDGSADEIPEARYIVNHPVFDKDFNWLDVGYHESQRVLVCGESFEPAILDPPRFEAPPITVADVLERLPHLIRQVVEGFHWNSAVDLINYIGAALMIPLMPALVEDGHPGVMFWGNQPGIGKSLAAQCLSVLKDGEQASPTSVEGGAREIENQMASELNDGRTVLFIDNQKGMLNIPIIEANMTSKQVAIRGFHVQRKVRRPNDLLWLITTNDAMPSDDLLSRCVHIRLHYEGLPDSHRFAKSDGELVAFVSENRSAILAEFAGMIGAWLSGGRRMAESPCRFAIAGSVIGSVLTFNGLPGFLSNTRDEIRENSAKHQQLIELVERMIDSRPPGFLWNCEGEIDDADATFKKEGPPKAPMEQKDWVPYLLGVGVIPASADTPQKQKKAATQYLSSVVKVPVEVAYGEGTVQAMIVSRVLRSHRSCYALAVRGLPPGPDGAPEACSDSGWLADAAEEVGDAPATDVPDDVASPTEAEEWGENLWD